MYTSPAVDRNFGSHIFIRPPPLLFFRFINGGGERPIRRNLHVYTHAHALYKYVLYFILPVCIYIYMCLIIDKVNRQRRPFCCRYSIYTFV